MITVQCINYEGNHQTAVLDRLPDECPFCHRAIAPKPVMAYAGEGRVEVFMFCPRRKCERTFVGYYWLSRDRAYFYLSEVSRGARKTPSFSETIQEISPDFVKIYGEASVAEQEGLREICGVGYRKALEFLVKDYAVRNNPSVEEEIKGKLLGQCINGYIENENIRSVAKRAAWLGNDETHYVRKWAGKNLTDLKVLIDLTIHWIEMEALTEKTIEEMPEGK